MLGEETQRPGTAVGDEIAVFEVLQDAGIGADIYGGFENHMLEDLFCIVAKNTKSEDYDRFYAVIRDSLQKIVDEGINEKAILAGAAAFTGAVFRLTGSDMQALK